MEKEFYNDDIPCHVDNILKTNFTDYFKLLSRENQERNINYAIKFVRAYLNRNKGFTTSEQDAFLGELIAFKVDLAYETRYKIKERIEMEPKKSIRNLMMRIDEDYEEIDFIDPSEIIYAAKTFNFGKKNKYGEGLARFASIILAREKAKLQLLGDKKSAKFKRIESLRELLSSYISQLSDTFAHEDRALLEILKTQFEEDDVVKLNTKSRYNLAATTKKPPCDEAE